MSYVECFDNVIEILAVAGDNHLGGDDIDRAIGAYFCRENGLQEESLSLEDQAQLRKLSELWSPRKRFPWSFRWKAEAARLF